MFRQSSRPPVRSSHRAPNAPAHAGQFLLPRGSAQQTAVAPEHPPLPDGQPSAQCSCVRHREATRPHKPWPSTASRCAPSTPPAPREIDRGLHPEHVVRWLSLGRTLPATAEPVKLLLNLVLLAHAPLLQKCRRHLAEEPRRPLEHLAVTRIQLHQRVSQIQLILRPGDSHVEQPPLLLDRRRALQRARTGKHPIRHPNDKYGPPLQPLRLVDR